MITLNRPTTGIHNALVSVSDRRNLDQLLAVLERDTTVYATSGSYKALHQWPARCNVRHLSDWIGLDEMPGGLVKTLHPALYAAILGDPESPEEARYMAQIGAEPLDLVVCNLYPFQEAVAQKRSLEAIRTQIDIGGVTLIRAAAKNFSRVSVLVDPSDYGWFADELQAGPITPATRWKLAQKAFQYVADYDQAIAQFFNGVQHD